MSKDYSIDCECFGIRVINLTPVQLDGREWLCIGFEESEANCGDYPHIALAYRKDLAFEGDLVEQARGFFARSGDVTTRVHSECLLGDALHSTLCDCGEQLRFSLRAIVEAGEGVLVYLRQEGRGIGMRAKLACLAVQEGYVRGRKEVAQFVSPDDANRFWGFAPDLRRYGAAAGLLQFLGVDSVRMIGGNLDKLEALERAGVAVSQLEDMPRCAPDGKSRQGIELQEKMSRNYCYRIEGEGGLSWSL